MTKLVALPWFGSTTLGRAIPLLGSGVAHVAVFASMTMGSGGAHAPASTAPETVIAIETIDEPAALPAPKVDEVPASIEKAPVAAPRVGHTHPYPTPASHDATPHDSSIDHHSGPAGEAEAHAAEPAPPAAPAPAPEAPKFTISIAPKITVGTGHGHGAAAAGTGNGAGAAPPSEEIVPAARVSVPAHLVSSATAAYPPDARASEVEADVPLEIVVDTSGRVVEARPLAQSGYGFDAAALAAIKRYRFAPAQKDGRLVRVRMRWSVQFRLR